ncbi:uncharacterized protein LOC142571429 [Dermacentor variabilis]|uniref:uncharacterized protein LOC142571429 n=1 Tax=Dermacentor variabilis TaxID=34621 RepID=UPI003F5C3C50
MRMTLPDTVLRYRIAGFRYRPLRPRWPDYRVYTDDQISRVKTSQKNKTKNYKMAVPPVVRSRRRFMPSDDIIILQEVLKHNPFDDPTMWVKISEKLSELTQVVRNLRSVRERLDLLLAQFLRDDIKNRKKSGTEEVYEVVHRLLQQVADLAREYSYRPPRSAVRSHRGTNKGRPVCAAASAAGAKQRQPSTRKTAAMECFAASSTDCGENSDVHVFVPEPEPEEEPDDPGRWASSGWPASPEPCCRQPASPSDFAHENPTQRSPVGTGGNDARLPLQELPANATGTCHGTVHGNSSSSNRPLPPAAPIQATPRVRRTPLRGTRGHNEATLAYLEARSDQEMQMRMLGHELDRERLALQIRQHDDKMRLHIRQHDDNVRLREQELELRKTELAALLEERRSSQVYQTAQLELIKALTEKLQK